jgi:AraC family transcriptional regulator
MEWVDKLNKSIGYIENNLRGEISYDEITRICCCTLPKFQQIFSATCGIPVSEYIRNRRMTIAAYELINTDIKVIDLAMMLGYDSPESFTRAYQIFHGVSPSTTRKTKSYEEYFRASLQIQVYGGKFKMGTKAIMRIETERLIIRKFQAEDWKDLQELAISNTNSEFGDCDEQWPLDVDGIKGACNYFASENHFWAVEVKDLKKVVCFINFNGINENQNLNIGHIINSEYLGNDYEYEALKALYNYGFLELGALEISATWTLADKKKLAPLEKLGMKVVRTFMANKFKPNPDGTTSQFEGCNLVVTREEWVTNPAV